KHHAGRNRNQVLGVGKTLDCQGYVPKRLPRYLRQSDSTQESPRHGDVQFVNLQEAGFALAAGDVQGRDADQPCRPVSGWLHLDGGTQTYAHLIRVAGDIEKQEEIAKRTDRNPSWRNSAGDGL